MNYTAFPSILCIRAVNRKSRIEIRSAHCQAFNTTNVESTTAMDLVLVQQKHQTVLGDHQPPSYKGSSSRVEFKADVQQKNPPPTSSSIRFGAEDGKKLR